MTTSQHEKALAFKELHSGNNFLVLPNIWDPIGARVIEQTGYPAVATASAAVSASLGFDDGEQLRRETVLYALRRIAASVDVPVTADIERGYADSVDELKATIAGVMECGVVGINIEDSVVEGGALRPVDEQCRRIAAVREASEAHNIPLVINARVDSFLNATGPSGEEKLDEAVTRAEAYSAAGADCIFPVGPGDRDTLLRLREKIDGPLNILASPRSVSLREMKNIGINRVSFGPFVFRSCLHKLLAIAHGLREHEDHQSLLEQTLSADEVGVFLKKGEE